MPRQAEPKRPVRMIAQRPGETVVSDMIVPEMDDRDGLCASTRSERRKGGVEIRKRGGRRQNGRFERRAGVNARRMARPARRGGLADLDSGECAKNRGANVGHERALQVRMAEGRHLQR